MGGVEYTENPLEVPRYREFAARIAAGETQTKAMELSGVKGNSTVAKLLKHPRVLDYIHDQRQQYLEQIDISREDILRGFLSAIADAKQLSDPATQIAGWREIGKFEGQYAPDRKEVNISGSIEHVEKKIESMSTNELMEYMEQIESGDVPIDLQEDEEGVWQNPHSQEPESASGATENSPRKQISESVESPQTTETSSTTTAPRAGRKSKKSSSGKKRSSASSKEQNSNDADAENAPSDSTSG